MTEQLIANKYLKRYYDLILSDMATHYTRPSFTSAVASAAKTYEMEYVNGKYTLTLTDTNNVLSKYKVSINGGASASISGNTLTISSTKPLTSAITLKLNRKMPSTGHTTGFLIWSVPGKEADNQDMVSGIALDNDPVPSYLKVAASPGDLRIQKESEDGVTDGITFRVEGNGINKTVTTVDGVAYLDNLNPGQYTVTEITDDVYEAQSAKSITVTSGQTATVSFYNVLKRGALKIVKTAEDGKVDNVPFHIAGNGVDKDVTTNASGEILIENLLPGTYTVTEQSKNYYEPQEVRTVTVVYDQTAIVTFNNTLKRGDLTVTKNAEDGLTEGATFRLYGTSDSGITVDEYAVVGSDGKAYFKDVLTGLDYTLEEVNVAGKYVVPDGQSVDILWEKVTDATFVNELKRGELRVTKTAEDGLVEGLRFHLYGISLSGEKVDLYATVDQNGIALFRDVLIGSGYTLEEVNCPDRYVIPDKQIANIEWHTVTERSFHNVLKKWRADIFKIDISLEYGGGGVPVEMSLDSDAIVENLGSPYGVTQGDATLAGAVYGVYRYDELVDTYVTDKNGYFLTDYYPCGEGWNIREITPSEGYLLDENPYWIDAEPGHYTLEYNTVEMDVYEEIIAGGFYLIKHSDNGDTQIENEEAGAEFEVYLKSAGSYDAADERERAYLITDEYGFAAVDWLPYGIYTVKQVKGAEGVALMEPFDVYINEPWSFQQFLINNAPFTSYVKVNKVDAESGLTIPYAGAGFQIYRPDGTKVTMQVTYPEPQVIDTFYTNGEGYLVTPETLGYGKGYSIVEVKAPYSYILNAEPVYFDITEDASTSEDGITVVNVTRSNMPQKGVIHITKTGEVFQSVIQTDDIYKPVYKIKHLSGAVFAIRAAEDIYTLDGVLHYAKGELVDTVTTESDGIATSKELYLGKYEIQEITASHGMVLNSKVQTVELVYAGQEISITETSGHLYNERQRVQVSLSKVLERNDLFGIGLKSELSNITFGLYAQTDIVAADGTLIPEGGLIEILSFDASGKAVCQTDLPFGSYYLQERTTDDHYILNTEKYGFTFAYGSQEDAVIEITVNNGEAINNALKYGSVSGLKVDEDGKAIAGAVFGLFGNDANEYSAENAYMTTESAQDGTFKFENIPYGTWVVREITPATGFVLNEKAYQITIAEDGDVVEIKLENRYIRGDIEGLKLDEDGKVIAGAVFGLFNADETVFTEDTAVLVTQSDSEGKFRFEDIRFGKWLVRELTPATGFVLNETAVEVNINTEAEVIEISFENKYIRSDIKGYKVDEDGKPVAGALFGLFTESDTEFTVENAVLTATSDADGIFMFEDIRFGKWIVKELQPAEGFVADDTLFPVDVITDGAVIEIKAENRHIYGMVHTTKVDKDYPDNLLCGAVFEIYMDVNGNKVFDADIDTLVGEMVEYEPGLYELEQLRYGGYFLYELQAPVNFIKDDTYHYFEITTDGEMVEVENAAGVGFENAHMVGNLKIVKTSSDGRVEGFSFRITGENYDETFKTDENGEILIEGLRIGKYTVTEIEDALSTGYNRPAPAEVELMANETLVVEAHNEKITVPDNPQTGDDSNMALWIGLMVLSLGGIIGIGITSRKKRYGVN